MTKFGVNDEVWEFKEDSDRRDNFTKEIDSFLGSVINFDFDEYETLKRADHIKDRMIAIEMVNNLKRSASDIQTRLEVLGV